MFGLTDKVLAIGGGVATVLLAGSLAFVVIDKNATISTLRDDKRELSTKVDNLTSDLSTCRANRITLEEATRRQNEAVAAAKAESAGRIANLERAADQADADAARARREADRILARQGTGDVCADADALIMEEIGQ